MRRMKRLVAFCLCVVMTLSCGVFVNPGVAAKIVPWYDGLPDHYQDDYSFLYPGIDVYSDYILWDPSIFRLFYERSVKDEYLGVYRWGNWDETRMPGTYKTPINNTFDISVDNVEMTDSVTLCFDYTASLDLAINEDGKNTHHAFLVLLYQIVPDAKSEYAKREGRFYDYVDGYQVVKYVAPRTPEGESLMENGEGITVNLPDNFDPSKHLIGYTIIRVEDKAIEYKETYPGSPYMEFEIDTSAANIKLLDLSEYIDNPPKPPVVEPKPPVIEPEPDPEPPVVKPLYGDANSDGVVNLSDVTLMMQYVAGWDVLLDEQTSDRSRNGRVDLEDVSYALKFIAGWNV